MLRHTLLHIITHSSSTGTVQPWRPGPGVFMYYHIRKRCQTQWSDLSNIVVRDGVIYLRSTSGTHLPPICSSEWGSIEAECGSRMSLEQSGMLDLQLAMSAAWKKPWAQLKIWQVNQREVMHYHRGALLLSHLYATTISRRTLPARSMSDNVEVPLESRLRLCGTGRVWYAFKRTIPFEKEECEAVSNTKKKASKLSGFWNQSKA
jgi:hypothetical protein